MIPRVRFHCVVVTGLSGAGKSTALRALEDMGYFCVDNLPLQMLPPLIQLYRRWGHKLGRVAIGVDVRTGMPAREFQRSLDKLKKEGFRFQILFIEADDRTLLRRYSETRRRHPLSGSVASGIRRERALLKDIKELADMVVDSSRLTPTEVREVAGKMLGLKHPRGMAVTVVSFGYKYGVPLDADMVWDVRFLPNPNYIPRLRRLTGRHPAVARYVLKSSMTRRFQQRFEDMMGFLLERFSQEGKSYLTVAVGCTGGRHRSVTMAESLARYIRRSGRFEVRVQHRDADKD